MATSFPARSGADDRRFFGRYALFMLVLVFAGFAPSFYLRGIVPSLAPLSPLTPLVWVHGLAFSSWIILFWVQTRLIRSNDRARHMQLGLLGMGLASALLVIAYLTGIGQIERANSPPFISPAGWSALTLFQIPLMLVFLVIGWTQRRVPAAHKRAMLIFSVLLMEPALGRLPLFGPPSFTSFWIESLVSWSLLLPISWHDRQSRGRIHAVTAIGLVLIGGTLIARNLIWGASGWADFAASLPGL